jgi:hypothetical protein
VNPRDSRRRLIIVILLSLLAAAALRDLARLGPGLPWHRMDDFPDFYCAGKVLSAKSTPYTYEPLRTCEHRVNIGDTFRAQLFASNATVAIPAPLPPFDFVPLIALARLPFPQARLIDAVAIVVSVGICIAALGALRVPWELSAATLALSTAYTELNTGQIVPFALLMLVLCGVALSFRRDALAGVLAALTAIEPAAGAPVILAVLLFVPRARAATLLTLAALTAISVALVGLPSLEAYVARVVPAQAASEVRFPFQYSLTYALTYFGVPPGAARVAGAASYLAMLAIGLLIGPKVVSRLNRRELFVFVPALCSTIAGTYVHQEELCFALPALLILAVSAQGTARTVLGLALCAISIPWILVWGEKQLFLASIFACAVILLRLQADLRAAFASLCLIALAIYAFELHPPHLSVPPPSTRVYAATALVQDEWRDYADARSTSDPLWLAIKLPTWAGLLAALWMLSDKPFAQKTAQEG